MTPYHVLTSSAAEGSLDSRPLNLPSCTTFTPHSGLLKMELLGAYDSDRSSDNEGGQVRLNELSGGVFVHGCSL